MEYLIRCTLIMVDEPFVKKKNLCNTVVGYIVVLKQYVFYYRIIPMILEGIVQLNASAVIFNIWKKGGVTSWYQSIGLGM